MSWEIVVLFSVVIICITVLAALGVFDRTEDQLPDPRIAELSKKILEFSRLSEHAVKLAEDAKKQTSETQLALGFRRPKG